jgi:hypothetical protein
MVCDLRRCTLVNGFARQNKTLEAAWSGHINNKVKNFRWQVEEAHSRVLGEMEVEVRGIA